MPRIISKPVLPMLKAKPGYGKIATCNWPSANWQPKFLAGNIYIYIFFNVKAGPAPFAGKIILEGG